MKSKKTFFSEFFPLFNSFVRSPTQLDWCFFIPRKKKDLIKLMFCVNNKFCVKNSFFHYFWSEAEVWFCLSCSVLLSIINFWKSIPLNCPQISFFINNKIIKKIFFHLTKRFLIFLLIFQLIHFSIWPNSIKFNSAWFGTFFVLSLYSW